MPAWICATCGVQHDEAAVPPEVCAVCADERQWVPPSGQCWTTLGDLASRGHRSVVRQVEPGLHGVGVEPEVAIGQRALLVQTPDGNLLWDPPGFLDDAAVDAVRRLGGVAAVSASHPHFYGVAAEWSRAFDDAPLVLPDADRAWLMRTDAPVERWSGRREVLPGVTLVQCGGHFAGSAVVSWPAGADGRGALLVGDTLLIGPGEDTVSFLRSVPNALPLPERSVRRVLAAVDPLPYDRVYSGWWSPTLHRGARAVVEQSAERYLQWLRGQAASD